MPTYSKFLTLVILLGAAGCAQSPPLPPPTPAVSNVPVAKEAGAALRNRIEVKFTNGSDRLAPDAGNQLDTAARLFRDVRPVAMFSVGYSDASGDEFGNLILSAKRARTVKQALIARGIPANQIMLRAYGQSDPIDKANPDDAANRRVLVTWDLM